MHTVYTLGYVTSDSRSSLGYGNLLLHEMPAEYTTAPGVVFKTFTDDQPGSKGHLFKLPVHLLDLFLHATDLCLARLNLTLQLFDFEVEHKFEFFQLGGEANRMNVCQTREALIQSANKERGKRSTSLITACTETCLLVFFLELIYLFLLFSNGVVSILYLSFMGCDFSLQSFDLLLEIFFFLVQCPYLLLWS